MKIKGVLLVALNCCLLVTGQIFWKFGLKEVKLDSAKSYIMALFNIKIFIGLMIYGVATLVWFYILKKNDFTRVYPLQSFSYLIGIIAGYLFLNEAITKNTLIGTLFIVFGVFVILK